MYISDTVYGTDMGQAFTEELVAQLQAFIKGLKLEAQIQAFQNCLNHKHKALLTQVQRTCSLCV